MPARGRGEPGEIGGDGRVSFQKLREVPAPGENVGTHRNDIDHLEEGERSLEQCCRHTASRIPGYAPSHLRDSLASDYLLRFV